MKHYRTVLLFSILISISTECYSQSFGVKAGLNFSNLLAKDEDAKYDTKMLLGIHIGITADVPISQNFSFETAILLSKKGNAESDNLWGYNLMYIDVPLTAKATIETGNVKLYGIFGPYVGIGLSGHIYHNEQGTKIIWGSDNEIGVLKRSDFGLIIGGGVEINSFQIGLNYELGLKNISSFTDYNTKVYNRVLGMSFGYKFGVR